MMDDARQRFPALPLGALALFETLAAASRPIEDLTISEWAERYRVVSAESGSPTPGPWRNYRSPHLVEPMDCLHPDHPARRVTCRWAAQTGKTSIMENWFCYVVDTSGGSMMIVMPTLDEAVKFNRVKLQTTIDATAKIRHKVAPANSRDEQGSTTSFKKYASGFCIVVNAGSSKGLQMVSIKNLAMDEVTGYPRDVDGRGSPRDQARARQRRYGDQAKEFQGSTPGIIGECAITADYKAGDQRLRYLPCPHCGAYQALDLKQMRGPDEESGSHFLCLACGRRILNGHKHEMLPRGEWIACFPDGDGEVPPSVIAPAEMDRWRCPPCEGRCRDRQPSYHLWAAYATGDGFDAIWQRWQEAQGDTTKLRTFSQQDLAEPYDPGATALEHEAILKARVAYPARMIPPEAGAVVLTADVQGYAIKATVHAFGPNGRAWLIDREVLEGAPDRSDEPWRLLADMLGRTYPTASGTMKGIDLAGIDSGFLTSRVYRFCSSRPNCLALDGRAAAGLPLLGTARKQEIRDEHRRLVAASVVYPVGNYDAKIKVTAALANLVEGPNAAGQWPRGVLYLTPDLADESYVMELLGERLVDLEEESARQPNHKRKQLVRPEARRVWRKLPGRQNDWFDCTSYAYALAFRLGVDHMTEAQWIARLAEVHAAPPPVTLFDLAADPLAPAAPSPAPSLKSKRSDDDDWLGDRGGDW
jgi:phage terminase large subunit GpA-like protein